MKGILKRLATLTIMAMLVLCLLPMMSMTAFAESNSATYTDGVYVLEVTNYDEYMQAGEPVCSIELLDIENVDISINTSNQIVCSFKLRFIDSIKQERTTDYSFSFTVENKSCTDAISHSFEATYGKGSTTTYVVANGTLTRAARTEHTGGTATCVAKAKCSVCGAEYGELSTTHDWGDWTPGDGSHSRTCTLNTTHTESGDCTYSAATCTAPATCTICSGTTGAVDADAHSWGNWTYSIGTHHRTCALNSDHTDYGVCYPGEDGKCTVCGTTLVASLTSGGTTYYYATADDAFTAAKNAGNGTVTILANAEITEKWYLYSYSEISLVVKENVTLTLTGSSCLYLNGSISGGGKIAATGDQYLAVYSSGSISNVEIACRAECQGTIYSGTFTYQTSAFLNNGTIKGGTFNCDVENAESIEGGTFNGAVTNKYNGEISGGTFNASLVNEYKFYSGGTINADNLTLGENFSFTEKSGSYKGISCTTHQRRLAATCKEGAKCIFCGDIQGDPDPTAHSLSYSAADNVITETCAHGCADPATATLEINTGSVVYTGEEQKVPATVTHTETWRGSKLIAQYMNNTDVGTATVYIQAGEAKAVKTFEITRAIPTLEHFDITLPQNAVYDGTEKTATITPKAGVKGMGEIRIKYYQDDASDDLTPIDAGTYNVGFTVSRGDNFNSCQFMMHAGSFEITKAEAVKTAPKAIEGLIYDGSEKELTTQGTPNGDNVIYFWINTEDLYSKNVLKATDAGTYTVKWCAGEDGDPNYNPNQGEITVTIAPATITVTPADNSPITYGDTLPNLTFRATGAASTEQPAFPGALTIDDTKAGTYKIKKGTLALADDEGTGFKASNYILVVNETVDFVIKPRALTLTVEDQTITYGEEIDQSKYSVTGLAIGDTATVTLTPSTANITKSGKITAKVSIKNAAGEDVTNCYTGTEKTATLTINPDLSAIKDLTVGNVHYSSESAIKGLQDALNDATEDTATQDAIKDAKVKCAQLLTQINESLDALETEEIEASLETTASNVKLTDKANVTKAIADIKAAKEKFDGNYSDEDIETLDKQIAQLEAALKAIGNAEAVIAYLNEMPADVEPDDDAAIKAKAAYEKLTSNERSMVNSVAAAKVAALTNYKIVKGDKGTWKNGTLTFTINGDHDRFTGVQVNGKAISKSYYSSKSGSTIVTLKESYIKTISSQATHNITFLFNDGTVKGTFYIHKDAMTPATGDEANIVLYSAVFAVSLAALVALFIVSKKRKQENS